jgi:prepilin-type N-terminal cleavage/methylation domain-containing protein
MSGSVLTKARARREAPDSGFTLIEMMVAIGLFAVLMAMVSVFVVAGLGAIRDTASANWVQAQQQNALLAMSREVQYIDNPVNSGVPPSAILEATPGKLVFFTLSGAGPVDRLPYKIMLCTTDRGVEEFSWAPALTDGGAVLNTSPNMTVPTCDDAGGSGASRRVLLPKETGTDPSLVFQYWREATSADNPSTGDVELVPATQLTTAQLDQLTKITMVLSDPSLGRTLDQTVVLVNER